MAVLLFLLVGLLATGQLPPPLPSGNAGGNDASKRQSCASPKRDTVTEALNELITCLLENKNNRPQVVQHAASRVNFGRMAGSGAAQGPLLSRLYSTKALISDHRSHRLYFDLVPLFPPELGRKETRGPEETAKIEAYLSYLEESPYMIDTYQTLLSNDALPSNVRSMKDFVQVLIFDHWFKPYARQAKLHRQGFRDSSGFGHVFVGEYNGRGVTGFHNWLSIIAAEEKGEFQYKGYVKVVREPLVLASIQFGWHGKQKSLSGIAFGVDTEFQLAVFSACFVTRPGRKTNLRVKGLPLAVQTFAVNHQMESVGSAYFVI